MKRVMLAALLLPALAACGDDGPPPPDPTQLRMAECFDLGGVYFESEDTSAGRHIWCVGPDGAEIDMDGSE